MKKEMAAMKNKSILMVIASVIMLTAVAAFVTIDNWTEEPENGYERELMPMEPKVTIFLTGGLDNYDIPVLTYDQDADNGTYICNVTIYVLEGYEGPVLTGGGKTYPASYVRDYTYGTVYKAEIRGIVIDVTLTISASPVKYPVNYDLNGGEGTGPASISVAYGATFKAAAPENARAFEEGNVFKGWSTSPTGGVQYKAGSTVKMSIVGGMTLYAVWGEPSGGGNMAVFGAVIALVAIGGIAAVVITQRK